MKKSVLVSLILALLMMLSMPGLAIAADRNAILSASQALISSTDYYEGIDDFIGALDQLDGLTLQIGSRGNYVAAFQALLIEHGYLAKGEDDGIYGKKTAAAVSEFQQAAALKPTGIATVATQFMMIITDSEFEKNEDGVYIAQVDNYAIAIWPDYSFFIGLLEHDGDLDYGTYYFSTGDYYTGDFKDDYRQGTGTAYYANGDIYIGDWNNDAMFGEGIYYYGGMDTGEYYDGQWNDNMMNGKGTYVTASGQKITGTWQNNQHQGW